MFHCTLLSVAISDSSAVSNQSSNTSPDEMMDRDLEMDLKYNLERNIDKIITKYGSYVDCLRERINEKEVSPEDLRAYLLTISAFNSSYKGQLLTLMSDRKDELERNETITQIFNFLVTQYASFLNYEIFEKILKRYKIDENQEELKYPEHLKEFMEKHKISEFVKINPSLKEVEKRMKDSKTLILKFDIENTCRLAKIDELKKFVANFFDLNPSALHIVDIKEGCVTVTFLIPASVANAIFTLFTKFSSEQEDKLRVHSVLWLECNGYTYHIGEDEPDHSDSGK